MFSFQNVFKSGAGLKRVNLAFRLGDSLRELFEIYDRLGGAKEEAGKILDLRLESCLGEPGAAAGPIRSRFHMLLRAKDLHRFAVEPAAGAAIRVGVLETLLFLPTPAERWSAVRELLLESLPLLCGTEAGGYVAGVERYKQELSLPSSPLGKLLVTTAVFNFDLDQEQPPPNLTIRFAGGRFPENRWEILAKDGASSISADPGSWRPSNPLCRWEYLAADLGHAIFRNAPERQGRESAGGWRHGKAIAGLGAETSPAQDAEKDREEHLYCQFDPTKEGATGEQVELFPMEPAGLMREIQRRIHRRFHGEGVRALALVMERLAQSRPGEVVFLDLADLATMAGEDMTPAKCRARTKKIWAVVEFLAQIRCTRVVTARGRSTAQSSGFLTLLDVLCERETGDPHQPMTVETVTHREGTQVRLVVDPLFYRPLGTTLGAPYGNLPPALLVAAPGEHPYALALYLHLRQAWQAQDAPHPGVAQYPAQRLFEEAGLWVSESGRYRALESLKRELDFLRERGWLGGWRMIRGTARDAMDDQFRMEAMTRKPAKSWEASGSNNGRVSLVSA